MVTATQTRIGLLVLLLVVLLIVVFAVYWQHVTGASFSHLLADGPFGGTGNGGQGC